MSPVMDCNIKEEENINSKLLLVPVSPLNDVDIADTVVCPPTPNDSQFSSSFPLSLPQDMQHVAADDAKVDSLTVGCFADLQLDKFAGDNDLTSLDWLQDINLLQNISQDGQQGFSLSHNGAQKENILTSPYHPKSNPCGKPPYSFSVLIFMAIESSPYRRLPVKGIYKWIAEKFPFYSRAPVGWHNSVRHNLSLNKCFRKVEKVHGKGSSWCVDPLFRPNLLQAIRRTPYFPFQQIQMTSVAAAEALAADTLAFMDLTDDEYKTSAKLSAQSADMDVAATLASLGNARSSATLSERERKLLKIRLAENLPELVSTPPPSSDHIYGFAEWLLVEAQQTALKIECNMESPVDEVYDFGEVYCYSEVSSSPESSEALSDVYSEHSGSLGHCVISRHSWMKPEDEADDEEQRRLEGVRALLNLASGSKVARAKKPRRLAASGSLWAKAASTHLKNRTKRPVKVQKNMLNKCKVGNRRKVSVKRAR